MVRDEDRSRRIPGRRARIDAKVLAAACALGLLGASAAWGAPAPSPGGAARPGDAAAQLLLEKVLDRLSAYKDFQTAFVESSESRAGTKAARESGQVYFKRPDLWRWEYTDPERKVVLVRGRDAEIAIEGDPQVSRYDLGSDDGPSGIGRLLSGGTAVSRSFAAHFEPGQDEASPLLRLDPVVLSEDYEFIQLRIRRSDLAVREVVIVDPGGNKLRFTFEDLRANRGIPEALFHSPAPEKGPAEAPRAPARQP